MQPTFACRCVAALGVALLAGAADATTICRWTDENGRTQISDIVPERFRATAVCTDSRQYELSPAARREADERTARERAAAERAAPAASLPAARPAATPASRQAPVVKRPASR